MTIIDKRDFCPECNKPRELVIDICGNARTVRAVCDCEIKEAEEKEKEYQRRLEAHKESMRYQKAFGDRLLRGDFDRCEETKAIKVGRKYAENFDANFEKKVNGIVFFGSARQGKTFAAEAIARDLHCKKKRIVMMTAMEIVQKFQYGDKMKVEALRKRISNADLLIIDDIGASRDTEFGNEIIFSLVDSRYTAGKPLIVTTNKTLQEMQDSTEDQRLYGRILEKCYPCEVENDREAIEL